MPQIMKGGKYIFGWTELKKDGYFRIPDEACREYELDSGNDVILMSGSRTSGGFSINTPASIEASSFASYIFESVGYIKDSGRFIIPRLKIIRSGKRTLCWTTIETGRSIHLSHELMKQLDLKTGCNLLVARGSGVGPAFISNGPIFIEALKHTDILRY